MSDLTKFLIKSYLRKALTILGTYLITHDVLTGSADDFAAGYVDEIAGAVLLAGSTVWSTAYQWYVKRKVLKALSLPAGASPAKLEKAMGEPVEP